MTQDSREKRHANAGNKASEHCGVKYSSTDWLCHMITYTTYYKLFVAQRRSVKVMDEEFMCIGEGR